MEQLLFFQWGIDGHVMRGYSYTNLLHPPTHPSWRYSRTLPLEIGVRTQSD